MNCNTRTELCVISYIVRMTFTFICTVSICTSMKRLNLMLSYTEFSCSLAEVSDFYDLTHDGDSGSQLASVENDFQSVSRIACAVNN